MVLINPINPAINAIIIYILIIVIMFVIKPDFLYDHNTHKFREIYFYNQKTVSSLVIFGIILSVLLFGFFSYIGHKSTGYSHYCLDRLDRLDRLDSLGSLGTHYRFRN